MSGSGTILFVMMHSMTGGTGVAGGVLVPLIFGRNKSRGAESALLLMFAPIWFIKGIDNKPLEDRVLEDYTFCLH